jgi:dinuclear metal center YbgI/SA1388 family protein
MSTIKQVIQHLEQLAPPVYQESYDNCGLLTGDANWTLTKILVTLDCTEAIVEEAIAKGCNLIVAHHPIIFSGLKKLNGKNYVERTVIKALKNDIAIYVIHTNLDNVQHGVNAKICEKLGLNNTKILVPKTNTLKKLSVFVPQTHLQVVQDALFNVGAGNIGNYSECSFYATGMGTFKGNEQSNAFVGEVGKQHQEPEYKLEVIVDDAKLNGTISAMLAAHPYEEVAYDVYAILNTNTTIGSGMIGELPESLSDDAFLKHLKNTMNLNVVRFTPFEGKIKKVAVCGGSGSFLLKNAIGAQADAFVTGDFKYHEFFDAENRLMIADIGHYESEIFTINLLADEILKKFPTFAVILSEINTNPINYYI